MIIGLSGHIKSGKSTAATFIGKIKPSYEERYFAFKLKYIASFLTGEDQALYESQEGKEGYLKDWGMTRREILQKLGTESLRNNFHNDVWIKALFADYKENPECGCPFPDWIISDTRFKNEADAIKAHGGKILRINRPFSLIYPDEWNSYLYDLFQNPEVTNYEPNESDFLFWLKHNDSERKDLYNKLNHASEIGLDDYTDFDYVINNNGSVDDFKGELLNFLNTL